nr:unnamed protein product [Callosobruchus analis]
MMTSNTPKGEDNIMNSAYSAFESGPITFSATPDQTGGYMRSRPSQSSMGTSVPDSISRVNSVTNMLKRFFSREDSRQDSRVEANEMNNLLSSVETVLKPEIIKKITDEVIEEKIFLVLHHLQNRLAFLVQVWRKQIAMLMRKFFLISMTK